LRNFYQESCYYYCYFKIVMKIIKLNIYEIFYFTKMTLLQKYSHSKNRQLYVQIEYE
jgi:hypothetical protein